MYNIYTSYKLRAHLMLMTRPQAHMQRSIYLTFLFIDLKPQQFNRWGMKWIYILEILIANVSFLLPRSFNKFRKCLASIKLQDIAAELKKCTESTVFFDGALFRVLWAKSLIFLPNYLSVKLYYRVYFKLLAKSELL